MGIHAHHQGETGEAEAGLPAGSGRGSQGPQTRLGIFHFIEQGGRKLVLGGAHDDRAHLQIPVEPRVDLLHFSDRLQGFHVFAEAAEMTSPIAHGARSAVRGCHIHVEVSCWLNSAGPDRASNVVPARLAILWCPER